MTYSHVKKIVAAWKRWLHQKVTYLQANKWKCLFNFLSLVAKTPLDWLQLLLGHKHGGLCCVLFYQSIKDFSINFFFRYFEVSEMLWYFFSFDCNINCLIVAPRLHLLNSWLNRFVFLQAKEIVNNLEINFGSKIFLR